VKYAPKKVFILENGNYKEISYEALCYLTEESAQYTDKFFIPLHGMLMEVSHDTYKEFYKDKRRQKYLYEQSKEKGDISYDMLTTDEFSGEDILIDDSSDIPVQVERKIMADNLNQAILALPKEEQLLLYRHYYADISETELALLYGISQQAVSKRLAKVRAKLKKLLDS